MDVICTDMWGFFCSLQCSTDIIHYTKNFLMVPSLFLYCSHLLEVEISMTLEARLDQPEDIDIHNLPGVKEGGVLWFISCSAITICIHAFTLYSWKLNCSNLLLSERGLNHHGLDFTYCTCIYGYLPWNSLYMVKPHRLPSWGKLFELLCL